jgi:hypothetical protein
MQSFISEKKKQIAVFCDITPCGVTDLYRRFGTNVMPQFPRYSSALKIGTIGEYVPPKHAYRFTRLHGVISQKTTIFTVTAVTASELTSDRGLGRTLEYLSAF